MKTLGNTVAQDDDIEFIRAGLEAVSGTGRRALKDIAKALASAQNHCVFARQNRGGRLNGKGTSERE
jgi:hypothetical protein